MRSLRIVGLVLATLFFAGVAFSGSEDASAACPVTKPNGNIPPGPSPSPDLYGNGALWTGLWPDGTIEFRPGGPGFVLQDGSLKMKFPWWRKARAKLTITGRRLDAPAPPLQADIGASTDFQFVPTYIIFPTEGCWEVTGKAGKASLTLVTRVVKIGKGP